MELEPQSAAAGKLLNLHLFRERAQWLSSTVIECPITGSLAKATPEALCCVLEQDILSPASYSQWVFRQQSHNHRQIHGTIRKRADAHIKARVHLKQADLEVIKLDFIVRLKLKRSDWLLADMCPQAANHCALS